MTDAKASLEKLLEAGHIAKAKLYQNLLSKIKDGKSLTASELKSLEFLEKELEKEAQAVDGPESFPSQAAAAKYAHVSKTTIQHQIKSGVIEVLPDGSISRESVDRYLAARGLSSRGGDRDRDAKDLSPKALKVKIEKEQADLRYKLARAAREELLVASLKGTMVSWEDIEKEWASRVAIVTAGLTALVDRLPPLLAGKNRSEMQAVIREEIWRIRDDYARKGRYCPQDGNKLA